MYSLIDLFAGSGGFSRGFGAEGIQPKLAVESFPPHAVAYATNFPHARTEARRVEEVSDWPHADVVIGGPPCEPFTGANPKRGEDAAKRLTDDAVGRLVLEFARIVGVVRPRVFVMENVTGVAAGGAENVLREAFATAGYSRLWLNRLLAEEHGTPSRRTRLFVSNIPLEPRKVVGEVTVAEALEGLPPPDTGFPNHGSTPLAKEKLGRVSRLRPGASLVKYEGYGGRRHANWLRLYADQLAPPVMGKSRFIHPTEDRVLTVREHARLMGFPDEHLFSGGRETQYEQAGEAVPPPLARAVASEVLSYLQASNP